MKFAKKLARRHALGLACAALVSMSALQADAQVFHYRATVVDGQSDRVGAVNANGLVWQCQANACTISGPWSRPGVHACAKLAQLVGRIATYGRSGAMLNPTELAQCNANMAADGPRATPVNPGPAVVIAVPAVPVVPVAQPIRVVRANDSLRYTGHRHLSGRTTSVQMLVFSR